jgi:hypothetical protein
MNAFITMTLVLCLFTFGERAAAAEKPEKKEKSTKEKSAKEEKADKERAEKAAANAAEDDDADPEISEILDGMGYPELQVVPRATERLKIEAKAESGNWYVAHWPVELSGLATLAVGFSAGEKEDLSSDEKDSAGTIKTFTQAVGLGWVVGGVLLGAQRPYTRGQKAVQKVSGKDERAILLRERLAEETLEKPARTMRMLEHVAVATNFTMNALSMVYTDDDGKVIAGIGAVLSFLPYMFQDHSISVYDKHIEYKKKIYTPLKGASVWVDPETHKITPMTTLVWNF